MKCENCDKDHKGNFGSGRFCSLICSRSFSTKGKRKEINEKIRETLTGIKEFPVCDYCKKEKVKKFNRKYCSVKCSRKAKGGWNNHDKVNWSEVHKKAYKEGRNYVGGGTTKWYNYLRIDGKKIKIQGTYELRTCKILDKWKEKEKIIDWQYTNDRIEYVGEDKKKHNYLLDFKIFEKGKGPWYIEVKGYERENDCLKWEAAKDQKIILKIWFLEDIEKEEGLS